MAINTQPTESDRALFDYVLGRSRARESSILAIATIASSASMVLFGLYFQVIKHAIQAFLYSPWIHILGITFAVLGITYREVTNRYIHTNDEDWLNAYVRALGPRRVSQMIINQECSRIQDPLCYSTGGYARRFILRSLFVLPIIAWGFFLLAPQPYIGLVIAGICALYPIGILTCDIKKR